MADINVAKPFRLTHDDGSITNFTKGVQSVADDIAEHWYVKAHLVGAKPQHAPGSPGALIAEGRAAKKAAEDAIVAEAEASAKATAALQAKAQADLVERTKAAIASQAEAAQKAASAPRAAKGGR